MSLPLSFLITPMIVAGLFWLINRLNIRDTASNAAKEAGCIKPNRVFYLIFCLFGLGSSGIAGYGAYYNYMIFNNSNAYAAAAICLGFGLLAYTFLGWLSVKSDISWDGTGLTGPVSGWPWPFGPRVGRVEFEDISDFGTDWSGSFFIGDSEGRRIRWSFFYTGFEALMQVIESARPDLFPDDWDDDFEGD